MSCNGQLWRPGGISPFCFSATRFILGICLLIKTSKDLTPSQRIRSTRSSHNSQYCRPQTYSDALQDSFFSVTTPYWNSQSPTVAEFLPQRTPKKKQSLTTHGITITYPLHVFSAMAGSTTLLDPGERFAHILQPIKDLTKNWDIDIAACLEDYLEEVC